MKTLVINDLHLGVQRRAGTTLATAAALSTYAHEQHENLLAMNPQGHTVVNGDLTDTFDLSLGEALDIYEAARDHLTKNPGAKLTWALGNHDLSKDSAKLGTVGFLGALLSQQFPDRFSILQEPGWVSEAIWAIPHMANQDLFDLALNRVPEGVKFLLLHCNFDNPFAGQQDHSLNITREKVREFRDKGVVVVLGHEHQGRTAFGGNLVVVGNQFPTSVADCLSHGDGQKDGKKYALWIEGGEYRLAQTWAASNTSDGFLQVDWEDLAEVDSARLGFIRVSGRADPDKAADVVRAIATFRQRSKAFVVTNAVKVETADDSEHLAETVEDIRSVNVVDLLMEMLDDEQGAVIRTLLEKSHAQ